MRKNDDMFVCNALLFLEKKLEITRAKALYMSTSNKTIPYFKDAFAFLMTHLYI